MCKRKILPTSINAETSQSESVQLTYMLNRWLRMIRSYGKLDATTFTDDLKFISAILQSHTLSLQIKQAVRRCRDHSLAPEINVRSLIISIRHALDLLCKVQSDAQIERAKKEFEYEGMTELYRPLSKRLRKLRVKRLDKSLIYTDEHTDSRATTRLVRRIVEKRAAQYAHRTSNDDRSSRCFRRRVIRAVSFNMYNLNFDDYDARKRAPGTHWRIIDRRGKKELRRKRSYLTLDAAQEGARRYKLSHPEDTRDIHPYRCDHCGKWHIGHAWLPRQFNEAVATVS